MQNATFPRKVAVKKTQLMFGRPTDKDSRGSGAEANRAGTRGGGKTNAADGEQIAVLPGSS